MTLTVPFISTILAAALMILTQFLMLSVGLHRTRAQIGIGMGDSVDLERKMRRHGNLIENAPLFVIVLALTEMLGAPRTIVAAFAAVFFAARLMHVIGFSSLAGSHLAEGNKVFLMMRAGGATLSMLSGLVLGGYLLFRMIAA